MSAIIVAISPTLCAISSRHAILCALISGAALLMGGCGSTPSTPETPPVIITSLRVSQGTWGDTIDQRDQSDLAHGAADNVGEEPGEHLIPSLKRSITPGK